MSERIAYQFNGDHVLKFAGMQKLTGEQVADELNRLHTIIAEKNEQIAEPEQKAEPWIPVSERLPVPHEEVRFYPEINEGIVIDRGWFESDGRCWYKEYDYWHGTILRIHAHVSHWQPITEPEESDHD